jgi:hypothetical protein
LPCGDINAPSHEKHMALIRAIYDRGENPVIEWFDYSVSLDIDGQARPKERDGVIIEPPGYPGIHWLHLPWLAYRKRFNLPTIAKGIQIVGVPLKHTASAFEILSGIVSAANLVGLVVRQLPLDPIGLESILVQNGRCDAPETVNSRAGMIAHSVQRIEHGVFAHAAFLPTGRKQVRAPPSQRTQCIKNLDGLTRQRNQMLAEHFHA